MSNQIPFERLKGRENFAIWKTQAKSFLVVKGLWKFVTKSLTPSSSAEDIEKGEQALAHITLMLEPCTFSHIANATTAKEAWNKLIQAFENKSVSRKVDLLRQLVQMKLSECESMEEYVNNMILTSIQVTSAGLNLDDEIIASLMLAGLPEEFLPMVLAVENSNEKLSVDAVKNILLQDVKFDSNKNGAMFSKTKKNPKNTKDKKFGCHICGDKSHFASACDKKKSKKKDPKKKDANDNVLLTSFLVNKYKSNEWFIDSGATAHMTVNSSFLLNKTPTSNKEVTIADNSKVRVSCAGDVRMNMDTGNGGSVATLKNVECVPNLCTNLISVSAMAKKGHQIIFEKDFCKIFNKNNELVASASLVDGLYRMNCAIIWPAPTEMAMISKANQNLWHRRLGHICDDNLTKVKNSTIGVEFSGKSSEKCVTCIEGKQSRLPFPECGNRANNLLDLVHSDVCGPLKCPSLAGAKYFVTFVDDFSRKVFIVPIKQKSQVFSEFKKFKLLVENQCSRKIKIFRSDNGTEYCGNDFESFLKKNGIIHQKSAPYTPEQNGVAERINRTILDRIRCMLIDSKLSAGFWAEAASTAVYLINRIPCRNKMETPEEIWSNIKPDLSHLRVFGCRAMVHIPDQKRTKLESKSFECILLGYSGESKAYRLYNKTSKKIVTSRNVVFLENQVNEIDNNQTNISFPSTVLFEDDTESGKEMCNGSDNVNETVIDTNETIVEVTSDGETDTTIIDLQENAGSTSEYEDASEYVPDETIDVNNIQPRHSERIANQSTKPDYRSAFLVSIDPATVKDALSSDDAKSWHKAMQEEFSSLLENQTWSLVDLPAGKSPIKCKWVYKTKRNSNGDIIRHKARLVVKGFSQKYGIDYHETFAPVVRYTSIRFLIALAAKFDLKIMQMDAVTAFLNGELKEDIFMFQPEGFTDGTNRVCQLHKSLYGLKQSSRVWNEKLNSVLINFGLKRSEVDQCIYYCINGNKILYVAIYVDDVLIFTNDDVLGNKLKITLSDNFRMKDMGEASSVLGIRIIRDKSNGSIAIDQSQYLADVLNRFGMSDCNAVSTPLDLNQKISSKMSPSSGDEMEAMSNVPYEQAIGSLLFAAQVTRPDICFAVNLLSRYSKNPGHGHWAAVKRIMRYIKGSLNKKLVYYRVGNSLAGYCDADWASDLDERKSTTGYIFTFQSGAISWSSKRQSTIALSSTEAEFMAMVSAIQECNWLKRLEIELVPNAEISMVLNCDNKSAILIAKNNSYSSRTKHVEIKTKFIQEKINDGRIQLEYVPTNQNIADVFTKGVVNSKHHTLIEYLGLI